MDRKRNYQIVRDIWMSMLDNRRIIVVAIHLNEHDFRMFITSKNDLVYPM